MREARCQQLASQVSQLAEDRGHLNRQLAALSRALREAEQQCQTARNHHAQLYQAHTQLQQRVGAQLHFFFHTYIKSHIVC